MLELNCKFISKMNLRKKKNGVFSKKFFNIFRPIVTKFQLVLVGDDHLILDLAQ